MKNEKLTLIVVNNSNRRLLSAIFSLSILVKCTRWKSPSYAHMRFGAASADAWMSIEIQKVITCESTKTSLIEHSHSFNPRSGEFFTVGSCQDRTARGALVIERSQRTDRPTDKQASKYTHHTTVSRKIKASCALLGFRAHTFRLIPMLTEEPGMSSPIKPCKRLSSSTGVP